MVDSLADVDRKRQPFDPDVIGTFYLGNHCTISAGVFVSRKADAVTAAHLLFWLPPGVFSHQPYYILRSSIPEVPQPEQHGIFAVRARQFIDERFDCKDVRLGAKGP